MPLPTSPIVVGVQSITQNNGIVRVIFTDGTGTEVAGWNDFVSQVESRLGVIDSEFVRNLALAKWISLNPSGANPNQLVGKTATFDLTANNILVIQ